MNSYKDMFDLDNVELKVIRVFLLAFLILLVYQAVQFVNIRRIDKKHNDLLSIRNQTVGQVQDLLIQSSTIQRKMLNMALTTEATERETMIRIIDTAAVANDISLSRIETATKDLSPEAVTLASALRNNSDAYRQAYTTYLEQLFAGNMDQAMEFKNNALRPAYESYQDLQRQMLVMITDDLIRQSNRLSTYTTTSSWILFFLGLAPFIYAISKLIYLTVFIRVKSSRFHIHDNSTNNKS